MIATLRLFGTGMALALALTLGGPASADELKLPQSPDEMVKAMSAVGKPGADHAKLEPLAGSWNYTCKFWLDPSKPPLESTGTIERKWVLGGRFLEERIAGTGFDGKPGFEGIGLIGYDNAQKKYTSTFACSMGTGVCSGHGSCDDSGTKFTFHTEAYCPIMKKVVKGRDEFRIEGDDKVVMESYHDEGGADRKMMEIVAVRRK